MNEREIIEDLRERLMKASLELTCIADEQEATLNPIGSVRLHGKAEGVRLALSYLRDYDAYLNPTS